MPGTDFQVDFMRGVLIYRRITSEKHGVTQRPAKEDRKFQVTAGWMTVDAKIQKSGFDPTCIQRS